MIAHTYVVDETEESFANAKSYSGARKSDASRKDTMGVLANYFHKSLGVL